MKGGDGVRTDELIIYYETVIINIHLISRSKGVFVMSKPIGKSTKMKIKVKTLNGDVDIKDNSDRNPIELSEDESKQILESQDTQHLGEILYTHSSPG